MEMNNFTVEELQGVRSKRYEDRDLLFTPGTFESYYRDRYDRWDVFTDEIRQLEVAIVERGGSL